MSAEKRISDHQRHQHNPRFKNVEAVVAGLVFLSEGVAEEH